jgi:anaerobic magnesium-protoporphyrin IX monomethyl ester cyclase
MSIRANLHFLRAIVGDGWSAASFCRMLPYDGTAIKDDLQRAGRLRGDICNPDYDFLDSRVTEFYEALTTYVDLQGWIHGYEGLSMHVKTAWHEVAVMQHLFPPIGELPAYREELRSITRESNDVLLRVVEDLYSAVVDEKPIAWHAPDVESARRRFVDELLVTRNSFMARNQKILLASMPQPAVRRAAYA